MKRLRAIGMIVFGFFLYYGFAFMFRLFVSSSVVLTLLVDSIMIVLLLLFHHQRDCYNIRKYGASQCFIGNPVTMRVCFCFLIMCVLVYFTNLFLGTYVYYLLPHESVIQYQSSMNRVSPIFSMLLSLVLAPILEELFIRDFVYYELKHVIPPVFAGIISSVLFALMHGTTVHLVTAFLSGMLFVFAYEYFRTVLIPIGLHVCFNGFSLLFSDVLYPDWCFHLPVVFGISTVTLFGFILLYFCVYEKRKNGLR